MPETRDDTHPLGLGGERDWVATARVAAKVIVIVAGALGTAVATYRLAAGNAQGVKDKAEAGYQVTKGALQADRAARAELERRVAELEQALRAGSPDPHRRLRGAVARRPVSPPVVPATPPPKALPRDLDQAQRQVSAPPPPAPPPPPGPRGDAAP